MPKSKWSKYDVQILDIYRETPQKSYTEAARDILGEDVDYKHIDLLRTYIKRFLTKEDMVNTSTTEPYEEESEVDIDDDAFLEYCRQEKIDIKRVKSAKFVNHSGQQKFNVVLDYTLEEDSVDWEVVKAHCFDEITSWNIKIPKHQSGKESVVKISDLHLGAYIDRLIRTPDFNPTILKNRLLKACTIINSHQYDKVHVHIQGDLIESFTGLNHKNSWKNLDKGMHGAEAVKLVTRFLAEFLAKIDKLSTVKVVSGNHDRITSDNKEDVDGGAANLVSWGLGLIGFDVEWHPFVIKHLVGNICHINTHGHHGISRLSTKELCWEYGEQGMFNYVSEGHLHSRIEKLAAKKNFSVVKDDAVDHKRVILPSLFTGNFYSESNSWTSNAGFHIIEDNGSGKPNTFDYSL